jgi:hypothetical protein
MNVIVGRKNNMGKIKECIFLDNSMFDDGSIECKNFIVANDEGSYNCEWNWIESTFPNLLDTIKEAIRLGKRYVTTPEGEEISWD